MLDLKFKPGWVLQLLEKYTCAHTQLKLGASHNPTGAMQGGVGAKQADKQK